MIKREAWIAVGHYAYANPVWAAEDGAWVVTLEADEPPLLWSTPGQPVRLPWLATLGAPRPVGVRVFRRQLHYYQLSLALFIAPPPDPDGFTRVAWLGAARSDLSQVEVDLLRGLGANCQVPVRHGPGTGVE